MENIKKIKITKTKRTFDIVISIFLIILTSPLFFIISFFICIEHIWRRNFLTSLFYKEKRISQGEAFDFVKFNVFKPEIIKAKRQNGEVIHTKILEHDNKSLSAVGRIVQRTYLDELPQLVNVLKGDLSMVGPRPVNPVNYQKLLNQGIATKTIVKAGLTGNYQSRKGEPNINQDQLDQEYINYCLKNPSWKILIFDIKILFYTLLVIFKAKGI